MQNECVVAGNLLFCVGIDSYKWELSGGQKRIIGLVRAIIRDSKILLLDEPTNDLDPDRQEVVAVLPINYILFVFVLSPIPFGDYTCFVGFSVVRRSKRTCSGNAGRRR